jgi:hypothetical protein
MPRLRRTLALAGSLALLAAALSGCVAIKSQSAVQRLPGFVTLQVEVCVSDHDRSTYTTCQPGVNTAESDNGQEGDVAGGGRGQLLAGFRVPAGTVAPANFVTTDGSLSFARNASYTNALNGAFPPPAGFRWEGYLSTDAPFNPANVNDRSTLLAPEFALPSGANGAPFAGPFQWRAVIGMRQTGQNAANPSDPVVCNVLGGTVCFDSPSAGVATPLTKAVSDIGVLAGNTVTAGQGETATVTFPIQNRDAGGLGNRSVALSATTGVPGAVAAPAAGTLSVAANATPTTTVKVTVPPATPAGTYNVVLTATANSGGGTPLTRTGTGKITVVDKLAPSVRLTTPADAATFTAGAVVAADYACTDETNGSGIARCTGPAAPGAPIDTSSVGDKTFTVEAADTAGNVSKVSHTYTVVAAPVPAPRPTVVTPPPGRINVTIAFDFPSAGKSTTFSLLQVKGSPSGATVDVTCKGKSCPKRKAKTTRLTKPNAPSTLSLKPWLNKSLRAGTVLKVTATKPGSFGMVKTFKVRANQRPQITTTCLQPNSKSRAACAS